MLDAVGGTTSTACTSTTTSTRIRRPGQVRRRRHVRAYGGGFTDQGRLAAAQHRPAGPGDVRPDQGGQAVGEVRRQPVRHLAQRRPTRTARTPHGAAVVRRPSTPTPASGSRRSGSTTSCRSSTGTSAYPAADYARLVPWWAEKVRGTGCSSTSARPTTRAATRRTGRLDEPAGAVGPPDAQPGLPGGARQRALLRRAGAGRPARRRRHLRRRALLPSGAGADHGAPAGASRCCARHHPGRADHRGVRLRWRQPADGKGPLGTATSYAIYRFDGPGRAAGCDLADAAHLVGTVRATRGRRSPGWTPPLSRAGRTPTR